MIMENLEPVYVENCLKQYLNRNMPTNINKPSPPKAQSF